MRGWWVILIGFRVGLTSGSMQGQQLSRLGHVLSAIAVGEEAVVADAGVSIKPFILFVFFLQGHSATHPSTHPLAIATEGRR